MRIAALLLLIACEKTAAVESSPGSSTTPSAPPPAPRIADAAVATVPGDTAKVTPDAPSGEQAFADMLTAEGDVTVGEMSPRRPGADLGKQIEDLEGSNHSVVVGGGRGDRIQGPPGRITVSRKEALDDTSLTADIMLRKVLSAYMPNLKRCYKQYLDKDPAARGKFMLPFTVGKSGGVTPSKVLGFAKEVDDCIGNQVGSWRFALPKAKDGTFVDARFALDLRLVPD